MAKARRATSPATTPTYPSREQLLAELKGQVAAKRTNPETIIQRQIKTLLEMDGWYVFRIHQSLGSTAGIADLVAMADGRTVWIEVKTPKGRQSPAQKLFEWGVRDAGGEYLLARSEDDIKPLLRRVKPQ